MRDYPSAFEWDDAKADSNVRKHGITFSTAIGIFADSDRVEIDACREQDREVRRKVVGVISGRVFTLVFVMRGDVCRLISARRANSAEEQAYGQGKA